MAMKKIRTFVLSLTILAAGCGPARDEIPAQTVGHGVGLAPGWLVSVEAHGTWTDKKDAGKVRRGWVDARVKNTRFHKRVFVEVAAPYGKAVLRTLHPAWFKGGMSGGRERWGVDTVQIYPAGGPHGAKLSGPVVFRVRLQDDPDHDGKDQMLVTPWRVLFGSGTAAAPASDPWAPGLTSPVRVSPGSAPVKRKVYFTPFDDAGLVVVREIQAVTKAQKADPGGRHTVHAAIYNINDFRIADALIQAHQAGVEVRLVTDARKLHPDATWQTQDDRLLAAGVPLLGARYRGDGAMHFKFALLDGRKVATGSFNWEWGSSKENHENMILTDAPELVAAYARRFEAVAASVRVPRSHAVNPGAVRSVSFAPDEAPCPILGKLLDSAKKTIHVAMFTAKDVSWTEGGVKTSIFKKLGQAVKRGVQVILVTDHGIAEGGEYFGKVYPDDPSDEWLESLGVHVVRADNTFGKYASMHHKFAVIDGQVVVTGALNWYHTAAYQNDEDQLIWRDKALAAVYTGELTDLLRRYDTSFSPAAWPQVRVRFAVEHGGTQWGDSVAVVGDVSGLGGWSPAAALALNAKTWPVWRGSIKLPAGVRVKYKAITRHQGGAVTWQQGGDRAFQVPVDRAELEVVQKF